MDGDEDSKTDSPTKEELRQRRLAYFRTKSISKEESSVKSTEQGIPPPTVNKTNGISSLYDRNTETNEKKKGIPEKNRLHDIEVNEGTKENLRSHDRNTTNWSHDQLETSEGFVTPSEDKDSKSTELSLSLGLDRDAGGWDVNNFSEREFPNDDFDDLKEQLKNQTINSGNDGYNELVERLIQCAKRDIINREESQRSDRPESSLGSGRVNNESRQRDSGLPVDTENITRNDGYTRLKQRNVTRKTDDDVHGESPNEGRERGSSTNNRKILAGHNPHSMRNSQDLDEINVFQKSLDLDHLESIGLHTHRADSELDGNTETQHQETDPLEEKIRKKSPRVLDEIASNELKGVLGEMKYKAFLEKSIKEIDELHQGQNSDQSIDKQQRKTTLKKQNNTAKQTQKYRKPSSGENVHVSQKSDQTADWRQQTVTEKDTTDQDSSTLVNGSLTEITQTDHDGGQESARPLLNRPKYDPIRNVFQQNEEEKDNNSTTSGPRNYEQVNVPRNVVFSASQIYQQAYKGGHIPGYEGMPPSMYPYHPEMAMNPAVMHMTGHPYGNMYDSMQHNPYYNHMPFQGPPASPVHGSFMYPYYPMQGPIPSLPGGPPGMPHPSEQGGPAVDAYLQQLSARSYQSYNGSDAHMYNQYPTSYTPLSKVPHPPDSKMSSSKKPPLPNSTGLKSPSVQGMKMGQLPTQMFYPQEQYPPTSQALHPHPFSQPQPTSAPGSQSTNIPELHPNYIQQPPKGIPYPPPPENVDLQAYFQFLESQGYPVPYQVVTASQKHPDVEQVNEGGTPQGPYEMMVPRPPSQSKKSTASPRLSSRQEKLLDRKKPDSGCQTPLRDSMDDRASQSSQRHVDGIRQYHEQKRQQNEDEEVLERQRTFAKASIDRYFNSLESLYRREKASNEDREEETEEGNDEREAIYDDRETMVNTEVTVATVKAGGITDRMERLGLDLSFLRDGKEHDGQREATVNEENKENKGDNPKDKRVIVCPECGEINKPYMTWCGDCGDILIGVEPLLPMKKKFCEKNQANKIEKIGETKTDKNVTFNETTDCHHGEIIDTNHESPVYGGSPKGKISPNKSESRDSGRPSSEDLDCCRTEKEVIDICESIDDPVVKGFIKSYFNRKRQALEETRKSLEGEFQEVLETPMVEEEWKNNHSPSGNTENLDDIFDDQDFLRKEEIWLHEQVSVQVEDKPLRGKKSGPLDIEVFSVTESKESRNSSRVESVVPMLNLVNSSDEEDEVRANNSNQEPMRPSVGMSTESDDWHQIFEQQVRPTPSLPLVPLLLDLSETENHEKGLLEQIVELDISRKPPVSGEPSTRKGSKNSKKSKVRSSIEAPGYHRHWERSSIAWGSYNPRELSTNSSVKGPQNIKARPSSASRRLVSKSVSVDSMSQPFDETPTNSEVAKQSKKPRPSSADLSKRKQRPSSAQNPNRKTTDFSRNSHDRPNSSDNRRGRLHHRSTSENSLTPNEQDQPLSSERRTSPARRIRPKSKERNLSHSRSPDIVENSLFVPRPPSASDTGGRAEQTQQAQLSPLQHPSAHFPPPQPLRPELPPSQIQPSGSMNSVPPTPIPDSPSSLPYVVDHRLPAEVVMDPPLTSHTNAESVLNAYSKYHEMTPRIQKGKFSAWLCLPDEILLHILSYLTMEDLARCARTCTDYHRVAMDDSLWKYITVKKKHHLTDDSLGQIGKRHPVSLAFIQCHGDSITTRGLRDLFRECGDSLKELNLCGCSRGALTGDCILLHASARCRGLTHIDASWCNVTDSGIGAISGTCDRLESLCINGCQNVKDEGLETVLKKHGKSLRHLEMFGCFNVTPKSIRYMANHCLNLMTLNLGQCYKLTDSCISQLSSSLSRVENLDLRGCKQIKDNCIRYVVKNCPRLQTISLANCPNITDVSMLEVSTYLTDIRNIDVCGCRNITDNSIRALANNCQNLRNIDISSTGCSQRSVSMLANFCNQRLETVKLNFLSDITDSVIIKLAKHCRRLKLLHLYGCTSVRNSDKIREVNHGVKVEM
ncbi:uncharacterized protein LOC110449096 [Mizuhopecten yessoensis]|uniref:F-box/LRR-repeat protein 2 n=1 Tax=Mizuhopecten yessoensis TaxID=6573 RepID=A0A210QRX0_MIZYE|nr:uncharacterized protein LOC110449096 [Mizuhopecten yessoensis]OWF51484.1 F-box/LRR-repeat protein 2 [Mizuhopecten yessoensis]